MSWPLSQDYNEAVQNAQSSFSDADLKRSQAATNALGIPLPHSGNFADVYEMRGPGGSRWAVKCFTREVAGLRERYQEVSRHLQQIALPFTVEFTFLDRGIRVGGRWYPVLKMQWVEGLTLNAFVRQYAEKPDKLEALLQICVRMSGRLRSAGIAHGDLQHGNLLLVPSGMGNSLAAKLIDYDGMCVPSLLRRPSGELGHACYQHPQRLRERVYGPQVDRFPFLLIATSLCCLQAGGRALWNKYDSGDNLLFREADLQAPVKSPLFYELLKQGDGRSRRLVELLLDALRGDLARAPLLEEVPELQATTAGVSAARSAATTNVEHRPMVRPPRRSRQRGRWAGCLVVGLALLAIVSGSLAWAFHLRITLAPEAEQASSIGHTDVKPDAPLSPPSDQEKPASLKNAPNPLKDINPPRREEPIPPPVSPAESLPRPSSAPPKLPPSKRVDPPPQPPLRPVNPKPPEPAPAKPPKTLKPGEVIQNTLGMKLTYVPAGKFLMGTSSDEQQRYKQLPHRGYDLDPEALKQELPDHEVRLTRGFFLGVYEVTQAEYEKVMGGNPSEFKGESFPVDTVNWQDAMTFCKKLSELPQEKETRRRYRLPTEAEWEYACRAGTRSAFNCGDSLTFENANFNSLFSFGPAALVNKPSLGRTRKVGSYKPNAWGLYDMHGNVWEWCLDGPRKYGKEAVEDPQGPETDGLRVLRGGSWRDGAVRSAFRKIRPGDKYRINICGFRVVCEP